MYNMFGGERVRNPNGYGTVTKLSGERRKPWIVKVTVGYADNGRQIQKSIGTFIKRKEALACLANYNASKNNQDIINESPVSKTNQSSNQIIEKHTFKECATRYIEQELTKFSDSWFRSKRQAMGLLSSIMDTDIKEIDLFTIQSIIDDLKKKQMSESSLNSCKILCKKVFQYAYIHKWIGPDDDYTSFIDITSKVERTTIHKPFTMKEIDILKNDESFMAKILLVYICTGCRASELLSVERKNGYIICGLKSDSGKNRKIPIHSYIEPFVDDVLDYLDGYTYAKLRDDFIEYSESVFNVEHHLHDTRNTFATLGREFNMKNTTIKKLLGHKLNDITDDVYIHESIEYLKREIEKIKIV